MQTPTQIQQVANLYWYFKVRDESEEEVYCVQTRTAIKPQCYKESDRIFVACERQRSI